MGVGVVGEPTVAVVTIAPGEAVYEKYGHNLLLVRDDITGGLVAYDWGRFDFNDPAFLPRFVRGDMLYSAGVADGRVTLDFYLNQGRGVTVQELDLSPAQAVALQRFCERANLPANREYRYDQFVDNCSTRLRDAIDEVLGGKLQAQLKAVPAETTYRDEVERHVAGDVPLWFGLHAILGPYADQQLSAWQASFVPGELQAWLTMVELPDGEGGTRPLVGREVVLQLSPLPPAADRSSQRWWQAGLIGLVVGAAMMLLAKLGRAGRLPTAAWFLVAGVMGTIGAGMWAFTSHVGAHANQTVLLVSPLGLALAVLALIPKRLRRVTTTLAAIHLGLCLVGVAFHLMPVIGQDNAAVVALALPLNIAAAWVVMRRPTANPSGSPATSAAL